VPTSNGTYIKFATLEDKFGLMEVVLFPDIYDKYGHVLQGYGPFRVIGKVQSRVPGEANLIVESVRKITVKNVSRTNEQVFEKDLEDVMFFDPKS
jgi:DNA polymerase III alpha subunit